MNEALEGKFKSMEFDSKALYIPKARFEKKTDRPG